MRWDLIGLAIAACVLVLLLAAWQRSHEMSEREEHLKHALQRILAWANAYPRDIFPEPDWQRVHEALTANGLTLDAISAAVTRDVLDAVDQFAREALDERTPPT